MDSPFPGMDPYLEQHWRSVHHRLITYAGDQLQAVLPSRYRVEVEERVFVTGEPDAAGGVSPHVYVVDRGKSRSSSVLAAETLGVASPVVIELSDEPLTETYLEIVDTTSGNKVVTAIEFVSPTNKQPGDGSELYLRKQREYRAAGVSLVEIDLTRQGDRGLALPLARIPGEHRALYLCCVRRSWQPHRLEAYPAPLDQPLPTIGVPLRQSCSDVPLELQAMLTQCYRNGRYGEDIDYRADPQPPLPPKDLAWSVARLRAKGLRP